MASIEPGARVRMHFTLSLDDGTLVDSSEGGEPQEWVVGDGALEVGLERLLLGLGPGECRVFSVEPGTAFGMPDPESVQEVPREQFPADLPVEEGLVLGFNTPGGEEIPGTVLSLSKDSVLVDFNHPLAGRHFSFEVRVLSVELRQ